MGARRWVVGLALALVAVPVAARGDGTLIGPGRTFLIGGDQTAPVVVAGVNAGRVPVTLLRARDGREATVRVVAIGERFSETFGAGETALFRNASRDRATVRIKLTRELFSSAMRYDRPDGDR